MNSLFKTLANKHQTSRIKIAKRLRQPDGRYVHRESRNNKIYELKIFQLKNRNVSMADFIDPLPNTFEHTSRTELLGRMTARKCEYSGIQSGYLKVHHVRKLKDIKGDAEPWK